MNVDQSAISPIAGDSDSAVSRSQQNPGHQRARPRWSLTSIGDLEQLKSRAAITPAGVLAFFVVATASGVGLDALQVPIVLFIACVAGAAALFGRSHLLPPILIVSTCYTPVAVGPINGVGIVLLTSLVGVTLRSSAIGTISNLPTRAILGFIGAASVAALTALSPPSSREGEFVAVEVVYLLLTVALVAGFIPTSGEGARYGMSLEALLGVSLAAGASALTAIQASPTFYGDRQLLTIFGGSNYVAALATVAAVTSFALVMNGGVRLFPGMLMTASFVGVTLATASRTSTLVLILFCLAVALRASTLKKVISIAVVLAVGPFLLQASSAVVDRLSGGSLDSLLSARVDLWILAWGDFLESPLTGIGAGHLADELVKTYSINYAHNLFFSVLAQGGLLGLVYIAMIVPWKSFGLRSAAAAGCLAAASISMFEPAIETQRLGTVVICLSWVALAQRKERFE